MKQLLLELSTPREGKRSEKRPCCSKPKLRYGLTATAQRRLDRAEPVAALKASHG